MSRVAPNTPADKCNPRLSEGDQLVQVNGKDVLQNLHAEVVEVIQEARRTNSGRSQCFYFLLAVRVQRKYCFRIFKSKIV